MIPKLKKQSLIGDCFQQLDNLLSLHKKQLEKLKNIKKVRLENMFVQVICRTKPITMAYTLEIKFEEALIYKLSDKGQEKEVVKYPTENNSL